MQASASDEHKLLNPSQRTPKDLIGGEVADPVQIDAQMQDFEANGPRRSGRLSMSPIMTQILRQ